MHASNPLPAVIKPLIRSPLRLTICLIGLACLASFCTTNASGQPNLVVQIITTFDYPGAASTTSWGINTRGDVAGSYYDAAGAVHGYVRFATGHFSPGFDDPSETGQTTWVTGINDSRTVVGAWTAADFNNHGFIMSRPNFTEFDVTGSVGTWVAAVNNAGDIVGQFYDGVVTHGFINTSGNTTIIDVPGASYTALTGINDQDRTSGFYEDAASVVHGFFRDADGTMTLPIDFPGSTFTILEGINDRAAMVGKYTDSAGTTHGCFVRLPNTFLRIDVTGAVKTVANGINRDGIISGYYFNLVSSAAHGYLAQISQGAD
jgi:hypothetical protein